mgnify:CR=1 FL=1
MREKEKKITNVVDDFFTLSDDGYYQTRISEEVAKYRSMADTARTNGKKGGRPKKPKITQPVNLANPNITGSEANHKPITNNHKLSNNICQLVNDEYNEKLSELGQVKILSDPRKAKLKASIKQFKNSDHDYENVETWSRLFD